MSIWDNMTQYETKQTICDNMRHYETKQTICDNMRQYYKISHDITQYHTILHNMRHHETMHVIYNTYNMILNYKISLRWT